jgi:drug/metabolite transporter (DMT)-like permease
MNKNLPPITKVALLIVTWGSSFAFQQHLVETINPIVFTFYNFLGAFIVFFIYAIVARQNLVWRWREGLLLGVLLTMMEITQMFGLKVSTAANTSFISNLGMLIIPFLGWLLYKHRVAKEHIFALVAAIFGMYFLVGGISGFGLGDFYLIVSACAMGLYFLYSERFEGEKGSHLIILCTQQFFIVTVITGLLAVASPISLSIPEVIRFDMVWQMIAFTIVPYTLIQWASKYSNEITVAMYDGVVEPLVGGMVAWGFFKEVVGVSNIIGALIMVLAFGVSVIVSRKRHFLSRQSKT